MSDGVAGVEEGHEVVSRISRWDGTVRLEINDECCESVWNMFCENGKRGLTSVVDHEGFEVGRLGEQEKHIYPVVVRKGEVVDDKGSQVKL